MTSKKSKPHKSRKKRTSATSMTARSAASATHKQNGKLLDDDEWWEMKKELTLRAFRIAYENHQRNKA
jgi:hypothetical protein